MAWFHSSLWLCVYILSICVYTYVPHLLYPFICWCIFRLFLCFLYFYFFIFRLSRAAPVACGGSQARGLIGAIATGHATATPDPRCICNLHQSSRQHQILKPLSEARDQTWNLMAPSQIRFCRTVRELLWFFVFCFFFFNHSFNLLTGCESFQWIMTSNNFFIYI